MFHYVAQLRSVRRSLDVTKVLWHLYYHGRSTATESLLGCLLSSSAPCSPSSMSLLGLSTALIDVITWHHCCSSCIGCVFQNAWNLNSVFRSTGVCMDWECQVTLRWWPTSSLVSDCTRLQVRLSVPATRRPRLPRRWCTAIERAVAEHHVWQSLLLPAATENTPLLLANRPYSLLFHGLEVLERLSPR